MKKANWRSLKISSGSEVCHNRKSIGLQEEKIFFITSQNKTTRRNIRKISRSGKSLLQKNNKLLGNLSKNVSK